MKPTDEQLRRHTGSKLHRLWQCPASGVLPQNTNEDLDARTEPARGRGHVVHKYLERVRIDGVEVALAQVPSEHVHLCRALDIDKLPTHLSTEVAFAWNWRDQTARELGRNLGHRDYDMLGVDWSCEIPTTVDVSGFAEHGAGRRGYIGDYKNGHTKYPRPARNAQILIGAACIRYLHQLDDAIGELLYLDEDGQRFPQRDLIDAWTLDTFERELTAVMEDQPNLAEIFRKGGGGGLSKREGPHCEYCPAFKDCSAKTALVKAMPEALLKIGARRNDKGDFEVVPVVIGKDKKGVDVVEMQLQIAPGAVTVRNAAAVYEACERVEAMCRKLRDEVCGIAYHETVELSDGRVIEPRPWSKRHVDGRIAAAVLEKKYGRDKVLAKLDISLSLEAIKDLARENVDWNVKPRPVLESTKGTGVVDLLLKEIQAANGLATDTGESCKPHRPSKRK